MVKGIEQGTVEVNKGGEMGIEQRKKVTISDIARVLLADGTPTAKIALLTGLSENEIKRLIELNKANIF